MRRTVTTLAAALLAMSIVGAPGFADEGPGEPPPHNHLFVQRPIIGFVADGPQGPGVYATGFRRCVDLPVVAAHHHSLHTGAAGTALVERAGHAILPAAPLTPYEDCAALEAALPIRVG